MSRLDYFTIFIVVVCILAILGLLWYTTDIFGNKSEPSIEADSGLTGEEGDTLSSDDLFAEDDSLDMAADSLYWGDEEGGSEGAGTSTAAADEEGIDYGTKDEDRDSAGKAEEDYPDGDALAASGDYLVLGGTFKYMANAKRRLRELQNAGYSQAQVVLFDRGKYAVVLVNRFDDYDSAKELARELKGKGYEAAVYQK